MDHPLMETKPPLARSRSNTAASSRSKKRPLSRQSTTSIHSGVTQAFSEHQAVEPASEYHRSAWYEADPHAHGHGHGHERFGSTTHQMSAEDALIHSATQLQNPREYEIDPALGAATHNLLSYSNGGYYKPDQGRQSMPPDAYGGNYGQDSQMMEGRSDEQDEVDSTVGTNGPAKKASKSSAANELEMRQLFSANKHRTLPDIATELHGNERGPQSERQRQVFAMLWINSVCAKGKGSVPRGKVYSNYVSRCATERVTVLNPASFGKLVRVLFPGLKTRRLGVRGESKYHYVNFSLKDDQPELTESQKTIQPVQSIPEAAGFVASFSHSMPTQVSYSVDRAVFPSPEVPQPVEAKSQRLEGYIRPHSLYNQPEILGISQLETTASKMPQRLQFVPLNDLASQEYEAIFLPKIAPFVPVGTDPDSASALTALYRSHCTSLVDALRYCKEKTFFHCFTSFHGTLTMPVQKLFAHPSIAPWIEECDFVMYQKMLRVVAPLTLQVAPKAVLDALRNISERLVSHIQSAFQGHPSHVIDAKVAPATLFAGLLDRELRVNLTAHAAANMLSNPANRDQMYEDWILMVRTRKVAECVPTRGMDDVVNLLLTEIRDLLDPVGVPWEIEGTTPYGDMALRTGRQQQGNIHADTTTENVLDRWVAFLSSLPGKFPYATHAEIVWCVQSVGTAVMRDLTIAQGKSFGAWWVTKCWIDEMINFLAEQGGFLEYKFADNGRKGKGKRPIISRTDSNQGSRYSAGSDSFLRENDHSEGVTVSRPMDLTSQATLNAGHDDSGIGIRTPDDDFTSGKYEYVHSTSDHRHQATLTTHSVMASIA